jgi:hypothetical protein
MRRTPTPAVAAAVAAATLILTGAACAAQPSSAGVASVALGTGAPTASPTATATADPQEQGRKFAQCMRENGVDMPDPEPGSGRVRMRAGRGTADSDAFRKAYEACKDLSPVANRPELKPEDVERLRQFAACMRENGVDMPDPDPNGGFSGMGRSVNRDDPAFEKATQACRAKFPLRGGSQ